MNNKTTALNDENENNNDDEEDEEEKEEYNYKSKINLPIKYKGTDSATRDIIHWLNKNLNCKRPFNTPQLWIINNKKDQGLSTLLYNKLDRLLRIYNGETNSKFDDYYDDNLYDLVVFDCFTPSHKRELKWIRSFVTGCKFGCHIARRWKTNVTKKKNLPVIICSTVSIAKCYQRYPNKDCITDLEKCFIEISINNDFDIDHILI